MYHSLGGTPVHEAKYSSSFCIATVFLIALLLLLFILWIHSITLSGCGKRCLIMHFIVSHSGHKWDSVCEMNRLWVEFVRNKRHLQWACLTDNLFFFFDIAKKNRPKIKVLISFCGNRIHFLHIYNSKSGQDDTQARAFYSVIINSDFTWKIFNFTFCIEQV